MNNLAGTLYAQGDLAGARTVQEQVLEARVRLLGKEHRDTPTSMNNLAGTLDAQGDLDGAESLYRRALRILTEFRYRTEHEHPHFRPLVINYASLLSATGLSEAEILARLHSAIECEVEESAGD